MRKKKKEEECTNCIYLKGILKSRINNTMSNNKIRFDDVVVGGRLFKDRKSLFSREKRIENDLIVEGNETGRTPYMIEKKIFFFVAVLRG